MEHDSSSIWCNGSLKSVMLCFRFTDAIGVLLSKFAACRESQWRCRRQCGSTKAAVRMMTTSNFLRVRIIRGLVRIMKKDYDELKDE
ncbi:unnamed protein product [Angiostrongylus costaricensis]|uniref:Ovule protein n=1 Tax=Angiostrongylus costaricensis TaxID=334426 RepID=A0A0R3Q0R0_ANGCS|nr:unnamed protein product [Angiostrongylus costaricensis]